jgi:hypothetical protein
MLPSSHRVEILSQNSVKKLRVTASPNFFTLSDPLRLDQISRLKLPSVLWLHGRERRVRVLSRQLSHLVG